MGHIQAVIFLIAVIAVIFWRDMIKVLLMVALLLFIVLIAFGAVALIDAMQYVVK
jgi:hypothetical protein